MLSNTELHALIRETAKEHPSLDDFAASWKEKIEAMRRDDDEFVLTPQGAAFVASLPVYEQ